MGLALAILANLGLLALVWLFVRWVGRLEGAATKANVPPARRRRNRVLVLVAMLPALLVGWAIATGHLAVAFAVLAVCVVLPPLIYVPLLVRQSRRSATMTPERPKRAG